MPSSPYKITPHLSQDYHPKKWFPITYLHRDDIKMLGYNTKKISNKTMEKIANKIESAFTECCYWTALEYAIQHAKLKKYPTLKTRKTITRKLK